MSEPVSVKTLITPLDQTIRSVFSPQKSYFIDIYQREYKWTKDNVLTLLNDIEVRFSQHSRSKSQFKDVQQEVLDKFEPYFLDTFLTSSTSAHTAVVDGQQRLTTFLLILIKFYHLLQKQAVLPANKGKVFSASTIGQLIFESSDSGEPGHFKIFNENRESAFRALVDGNPVDKKDQTCTRIAENYVLISDYFDKFLAGTEPDSTDAVKTTYYLTYLLDRVSIVEIHIHRQENVAMIFEVVNDRGLGLRPYEILKGKLIGSLDAARKEAANKVWTDLQERYFKAEVKNAADTTVDLDMFFQTFFRAKFADSEGEYQKFEGDYHYEIYRNEKVRAYFANFLDKDVLFSRIMGDFRYFAELYLELRTSYDYDALIFNKLLDQNQQYLLIMSSITQDDPERSAKIEGIAAKFDQFHAVLRLLDAYDSNAFQRLVYPLNRQVRNLPLKEAKAEIDQALVTALVSEGRITADQCANAAAIFEFERFKEVRNQWTNFSKYVLMRIDRLLADQLDKPSYAAEDLTEVETRFNKNNRMRYGMHLEHILTQHPRNRALFAKEGGVDETKFNQTRNLLGMVLLLKDKQNLSSNDEIYEDKQGTYAKSNLIWNELLVGHLPSVDVRNLPPELQTPAIEPAAGVFPLASVDVRQRLVFEAIKRIWANV